MTEPALIADDVRYPSAVLRAFAIDHVAEAMAESLYNAASKPKPQDFIGWATVAVDRLIERGLIAQIDGAECVST